MPAEFLTDEQAAAYGSFGEAATRPELERFFFLDDDDRDLIAFDAVQPRAGEPMRLASRSACTSTR